MAFARRKTTLRKEPVRTTLRIEHMCHGRGGTQTRAVASVLIAYRAEENASKDVMVPAEKKLAQLQHKSKVDINKYIGSINIYRCGPGAVVSVSFFPTATCGAGDRRASNTR